MEILSTGQKIKRARIYKGITLKELCKDKISISKMSCIENGKVKADSETIKYISEIIGFCFLILLLELMFPSLKLLPHANNNAKIKYIFFICPPK